MAGASAAQAGAPADRLEQDPAIVAFAGHARPARESFGALGPFTLGLVCRADLSCTLFVIARTGEVDLKRTGALRAALDAHSAAGACVGPQNDLSATEGETGQVIGNPYSPGPLCLVRLDARGEPELVASPSRPALAPPVLGDERRAVTIFKKGPAYREFLGPARVELQLAASSGARWGLALVTAPASLNLYGCGDRRVFVFDTTTRAVDLGQTRLLARALDQALGAVGVGCARSLGSVGARAFLVADQGGKHASQAAAELRLGPEGQLPFEVRKVAAESLPPMP